MTMPENRIALRTIPSRRHREAVAGPLASSTAPSETLLGPEPDGMTAWRYNLTQGESVVGPDPKQGRGQYWVVTGGSLNHNGAALPHLSCAFVGPYDPAFEAVAGAAGVQVIAMQFPLHAAH